MPKKAIDGINKDIAQEMKKASRWLKANWYYRRAIKNIDLKSPKQCEAFKKRWGFTPIVGSASPCFELWEPFNAFLKAPHHERSAQLYDGSDNFYIANWAVYDPNDNVCENMGPPPTEVTFEIYWDRPIKSILNDIKYSLGKLQAIYKIKTQLNGHKDNFSVKIRPYKKNPNHPPEVITFKVNLASRSNKIVSKLGKYIKEIKNKYNAEERPRHTGLAHAYIASTLIKQGLKTAEIQRRLSRFDKVELTNDKLMKYIRAISKARKYIRNTYSY